MRERLKKIFLTNFRIKLLCILLAFLLWVFVASNQSLVGKFPNQIQIKPVNLSDQYQAFFDQDSTQVSVMAEPSVWRSLTTDSFVASVDLAGLKEGTYELDVRVTSNITGVQITRIEPAKVFVSIEKIVSKNILLSPRIEGDLADGMILGQIILEPETIEVRGPSSYIDSISEANALIKLNGESESFVREATVVSAAVKGEESEGVTFSPAVVSARVNVVKGGNNKTVGVRVKTKGNPKENYFASKIAVTPSVVDIVGQRSLLANINYIETEEVDLTNLSDPISKEVNLMLPEGVNLQKGANQKVKLEIIFSTLGSSKVVSPNVVGLFLPDGLRLVSYSPSDIKVTLGGAQALLAGIGSGDVRLELNLTGKSVGNHNVEVDPSMVRVPDGLTVTGLSANTLSVVIGN